MKDHVLYNEMILLASIAKGDKNAFATLVNNYKDHIYTIALRLTRSSSLAEDVVQEIFLKVWLRRETLPEINHFAGYLNSMVQNKVFTLLKQIALERERLKKIDANNSYNNDTIIQKEYETVLLNAVRQLPPRQQEVYELVKGKGLKREEAAQVLNISSETVKYHLSQAVRNVRDYCIQHAGITGLIIVVLKS